MKNLIILFLSTIFLGCNHSIEICIKGIESEKIEKTLTIDSDVLFDLKTMNPDDERTKLLVKNLCRADKIIFTVRQPIDLFSDDWLSYSAEISAYQYEWGKPVKYYQTALGAFCTDSTIRSPYRWEMIHSLTPGSYGTGDEIEVSSSLNTLIKNAVTEKVADYQVEKFKISFVNAETGDTTSADNFLSLVNNTAQEKKQQ